MIKLQQIEALDPAYLESLGFTWHTDSDETPYISDQLVVLTEVEAAGQQQNVVLLLRQILIIGIE